MKLIKKTFLLTALICSTSIFAQSNVLISKADDLDLAFEESIREFGYISGVVLQCQTDATQRIKHEREVSKAFNGLVRLFGSDRAFYHAAAFGAGSIDEIDKSKCKQFTEKYDAAAKLAKQQ